MYVIIYTVFDNSVMNQMIIKVIERENFVYYGRCFSCWCTSLCIKLWTIVGTNKFRHK